MKKHIIIIIFILLLSFLSFVNTDYVASSGHKHKIECNLSYIKKSNVMARQTSIKPVSFFIFLTIILVDSYFIKSYLWKAELPVFWGCKYRIQSPRCKLTKRTYVWQKC